MPTPNDPGPAAPAEIASPATDDPAPSARARRARLKKWFRKYRNPTRWALGVFTLTATALIAVIGLGIFWLAWTQLAPPDNDPDADRPAASFDIARSSVTLLGVLTVGGAAAVAYRRQIHLEKQTKREERQTKLAIANDAREAAKERRAERADLHARYQQAAAMLADHEPMIRIAGAYALEALAVEWAAVESDNVQRDVCIDLLCGYLRSTTGVTPATEDSWAMIDDDEKEVRDTIATVIARHLRVEEHSRGPGDWSDRRYDFSGAHFNSAGLNGATFQRHARFDGATFQQDAGFGDATFQQDAQFGGATFQRYAAFGSTTFHGYAGFDYATFQRDTWFNKATFRSHAGFGDATFQQDAQFDRATFQRDTWFGSTAFHGHAGFSHATFHGHAEFDGATFHEQARFDDTAFQGLTCFSSVLFFGLINIDRHHGCSPCFCDTHVQADVLNRYPERAVDLRNRGVTLQRIDTTCPKCRATLDRADAQSALDALDAASF